MELRQLIYFIQAAERLNFTEAAAALYISQSTLSQQIRQLEEELHIPLFNRVGKRVYLTDAGNMFLPYARQTLHDSENGRNILNDLVNLKTGTLRIGVTYGLTTLLTRTLPAFSAAYPAIKLDIEFGTSDGLLEKLAQVKLDFVLSFVPLQQNEIFTSSPLFKSQLSLVVHASHEWAGKKRIALTQLANLPLILPVTGFSIRSFLDKILLEQNIVPAIQMEMNDIHALLQLVKTGNWCTVLLKASLAGQASLKAIPFTGKAMSRQATVTWPTASYRKKAATRLAGLLLQYATEMDKV